MIKANPVYTVANFEVWGEARDAVAAKRAALNDGRAVALSLLMRRVTLFDARVRLPTPDAATVSQLITSLSVRNEKNSKSEYLAKLDFQFSEQGVKKLLRAAKIPYFDRQAPKIKLVPIVDASLLGGDGASKTHTLTEKSWTESWQTLDLAHGMTPIEIAARLPVIDNAELAALIKSDGQALTGLWDAYGKKPVVVALISAGGSANKIRLSVIGFDAVGEIHYVRDHILAEGSLLQTADFAAEVAYTMLEARWKITKMRPRVAVREVLPWQTESACGCPGNRLGESE